jgi:thiosulfate/3-mercaptopyruvate sulfurtransferase
MIHPKNSDDVFVTTAWLAERLGDPAIRVFDASWHMPAAQRDAKAEFLQKHIPGAVFFDIDGIADHSSGLPHMLPQPAVFASAMEEMGFDDGMDAVVYDSVGLFSAPRLWWMLRVFGVERVSVLEGGLPHWLSEGRPLEAGASSRHRGRFSPRLERSLVAGAAEVLRALEAKSPQVVDVRSAERFQGKVPEPRPGLRSGHMPGALNLPWDRLIQDAKMRAPTGLLSAMRDAGVDPDRPVIASCGSGVSAAILSLALARCGHGPATVYDGSWSEWGAGDLYPVVQGEA